MIVAVLLGAIWAAVLVPPALRAHAERREAFVVSFGTTPVPDLPAPRSGISPRIQRRRRILGGLAAAALATGVVGLLPTFRVLLVVHLFLVDSCLAYACLLASTARRRPRTGAPATTAVPATEAVPATARRHVRLPILRRLPRPAMLRSLPPIAPIG